MPAATAVKWSVMSLKMHKGHRAFYADRAATPAEAYRLAPTMWHLFGWQASPVSLYTSLHTSVSAYIYNVCLVYRHLQSVYIHVCAHIYKCIQLDLRSFMIKWNTRNRRKMIPQSGSVGHWVVPLINQLWFFCSLVFFGCVYGISRLESKMILIGAG